jgi:ABC-type arginine transport system permease subunit
LYLDLDPFLAGTATIGFIYGAFATEVFRGAFMAVDKGQVEAAKSVGMSKIQRFRRVLLPQMWRFALPGLGNVWMVLIKATALISVIQLPELMRNADIAARSTRLPFTCYFLASLIYLTITIASLIAQQRLEGWANKGVRRA